LIEDLTPRQLQLIQLAEQTEGYLKEQAREQQGSPGQRSVSKSEYNAGKSRREWADEWSD